MRRCISAAALALAAGLGASWWVGSALTAPAPRVLGAPPAELGATAVTFPSESGSRIHAWLVRGAPGRGAIVLAHSVRSNRLELVGRAEFLQHAGYSLLLFDAQAHGESPGQRIGFGYLEAPDARAAVAFLAAQLPEEKIGYLGVSQGGAAALLGDEPLPVQALILEAVYPTLRDAVVARIRIRLGPLAPVLAPLLLLQLPLRLGIDPAARSPIEGIRRIRAPLLLIAGERDRHTPLAESQRLFDAAPTPKQLWIVGGAAHEDFRRVDPAGYEHWVLAFLATTLSSGAR